MQAPKAIKLTVTYAFAITATYYSYLYTKDAVLNLSIPTPELLLILEILAAYELSKFAIESILNHFWPDEPKNLEHIVDKNLLGFFDRRIHTSFPKFPVDPDSSPDEVSASSATKDAEIMLHK